MARKIAIGTQSFEKIRQKNCFYVDKTAFLTDWFSSEDDVTLITRPRRFGKTLMMDTVDRFFSTRYTNQKELFEGLAVWNDEAMRQHAGKIPVIFLSFADAKESDFKGARSALRMQLFKICSQYAYLKESPLLGIDEHKLLISFDLDSDDSVTVRSIQNLCFAIEKHHGIKPIVILDEYDTPLLEAWVHGYWDEMMAFMRPFMNATFKTNPSLGRGLLTGITRVSKESIFSDLNNLEVVTTLTPLYETDFGFTEEEVFAAMDEYGLTNKEEVKDWYDGFSFGKVSDIYNPWSVTNFLSKKELKPYWANTSSNALVGTEIAKAKIGVKQQFQALMAGENITSKIKEEIIFKDLNGMPVNIWSLLAATGYLRIEKSLGNDLYELRATNKEVILAFEDLVERWFASNSGASYSEFLDSLMINDVERMNENLAQITEDCIGIFDAAQRNPENFYHGFVLGLLVSLKDRFIVTSNRESGYGRYDVMIEPRNPTKDDAYILEFKIKGNLSMETALETAKKQIEEKAYANTLIQRGMSSERIHTYGIVFDGKKVLVG